MALCGPMAFNGPNADMAFASGRSGLSNGPAQVTTGTLGLGGSIPAPEPPAVATAPTPTDPRMAFPQGY